MAFNWIAFSRIMAVCAGGFAGAPLADLAVANGDGADCGCEAVTEVTCSPNIYGFNSTATSENGTCRDGAPGDCVIPNSSCADSVSFGFSSPSGVGWIQADLNLPIAINPYAVPPAHQPYYLNSDSCGGSPSEKLRYLYNQQKDYNPDNPAQGNVGWIKFKLTCRACGTADL
jgi:hypothetical protein